MNPNEDYVAGIKPIFPHGTNSTMFTECCGSAICEDELYCPSCKRKIIGYDADSEHERSMIRWANATKNWKR